MSILDRMDYGNRPGLGADPSERLSLEGNSRRLPVLRTSAGAGGDYAAGAAHAHTVDDLKSIAENANDESTNQLKAGAAALAFPLALLVPEKYRVVASGIRGIAGAVAIGEYFKLASANIKQSNLLDEFAGVNAEPINSARQINDDASTARGVTMALGLGSLGAMLLSKGKLPGTLNVALHAGVAGAGAFGLQQAFVHRTGLKSVDDAIGRINAQEHATGLDYSTVRRSV